MHSSPTTEAQRQLWTTCRLGDDANLAFNEGSTLFLDGPADLAKLEASFAALIARHEALRGTVSNDGKTLRIAPAGKVPFQIRDWSKYEPGEANQRWAELCRAEVEKPFELEHGPLYRVQLVHFSPVHHRVCFTAHHLVCDGYSIGLLLHEWGELYSGRADALPKARGYTDYAAQLSTRPPDTKEQEQFWLKQLSGELPVLQLPTDRPRPLNKTWAAWREDFELEPSLVAQLKKTGAKSRASLFTMLLSGFHALLYRLSGQSDLIVGTPAAGQPLAGPESLVGHCINTLPIRAQVDGTAPFTSLMEQLRKAMLDALEHQGLTLGALIKLLPLPRDPSRVPLFSVCFNVEKGMGPEVLKFEGLTARQRINPRRSEVYDLFLNAVELDGGVTLECQYNTDLFDARTIQRWLAAYRLLLSKVAEDPAVEVARLPIVTPAEKTELLAFTESSLNVPADKCVHHLILEQIKRTPSAVAVELGDRRVTYAELDARANQLAHTLRSKGVKRGTRVGLAVERSPEMIIGLCAIHRAGAAYVPLDPGYPRDRLAFMAADAQMPVLVTETRLAGELKLEVPATVCVDDPALANAPTTPLPPSPLDATPDDVAYVIYTSGSTGKPKGVLVPHKACVNLICSVQKSPGLTQDDVVLAVTTLSFDIAVSECVLPLTVGARIVLASREVALDGESLLALLKKSKATFLDATPATWRLLLSAGWKGGDGLKGICTGEAMPKDLALELVDRCKSLWNGYGPTETTVWSTFWEVKKPIDKILIGRPVANTGCYVLDSRLQLTLLGVPGELWIGGLGVSHGYLGRDELTKERFVPDPFRPGHTMYKTGDLCRWLSDGNLECLGRNDTQVKLRGFRIELGEIEDALGQHPASRQVAVIVREDEPNDRRLVAYVVHHAGLTPTDKELRAHLKRSLPDYMVPQTFVRLDKMPLTPSGKIDRKVLPRPSAGDQQPDENFVAPRTPTEVKLCTVFAEVLGMNQVSPLDGFFELGGNSLLALKVIGRLREKYQLAVPVLSLFSKPTPEALAAELDEGPVKKTRRRVSADAARRDVAIIGMVGRYPGAESLEQFWKNLVGNVDSMTYFKDSELDPALPKSLLSDPRYVRARGVLKNADLFDAGFFGITPKEAALMDPQQRILLELAWEALESSGYVPSRFDGAIGIFAGKYNNTYHLQQVLKRPDLIDELGEFNVTVANEKDYIATRIAHKLDLTGPAISVHTACSTSLVATVQAWQSLILGECDLALAGAVSLTVPIAQGYLYQEGGMFSDDGHTRSFDHKSQGTVFNDGAGLVVLKRLDEALRDHDTIWAVLKGGALNNDGAQKASFTAPSVEGQQDVILRAHRAAGVEARSLSYVEAHGTATPVGDPIEVQALTRAFRETTQDRGFCALGSVKSNIGHAVTAAGVAGLQKVALSLTHETIPGTVHFEKPNPRLELEASPFEVFSKNREWKRGSTPRRAGLSSFGVGGTNAHAIIEEAPATQTLAPSKGPQVLVLSARTAAARDQAISRLQARLAEGPISIDDAAWTLQVGRRAFAERAAVVVEDPADALRALADPRRLLKRKTPQRATGVAFLFPGQGAQVVGMTRGLYAHDPAFKADLDRVCALISPHLGSNLLELLFPSAETAATAEFLLKETRYTQPALFATGWALARVFIRWGIQPAAMVGHSVGEFVCAVLAGVMSLESAAELVARRGALLFALPPGAMLSVRLPASQVANQLPAGLEIASDNGPSLCVVAGPEAAVDAYEKQLAQSGIVAKKLHTSHAFHSAMMEPAVAPFTEQVKKHALSAPAVRFVSTLTGTWITDEEAKDPAYWGSHLRRTVEFQKAARVLLAEKGLVLLELGPRATLATLARQIAQTLGSEPAIVTSLGDAAGDARKEPVAIYTALAQLWLAGVEPDWAAVHGTPRRRIPLPTYPFERQSYWVKALAAAVPAPASQPVAAAKAIPAMTDRRQPILAALKEVFEETSGIDLETSPVSATFLELGFDSLLLTQVAMSLTRRFNVKLTFRQLSEELYTLELLAQYMDKVLPAGQLTGGAAAPVAPPVPMQVPQMPMQPPMMGLPQMAPMQLPGMPMVDPSMAAMFNPMMMMPMMQMQAMAMQLQQLQVQMAAMQQGQPVQPPPAAPPALPAPPKPAAATQASEDENAPQKYDVKKAFGAIARIHTQKDELSPKQRSRLDAFIKRYNARTAKSKASTQANRKHMADPRVVSGFRPVTKELVYPIVVQKSGGPRLWDLDGNEYIDTLNGFGAILFGWQPEFVTQAITRQLETGHEIGPQHPIAGEAARKFLDVAKFTGFERAAFCNTGSEAVMGCMRVARTVTGRTKIASFTGSYHGIFDEVIIRGTKKLRAVPAAPGIMPSTAQNMLVLDYGTDEALELLRKHGPELAAIMVEPVQSRRPDFQPKEFLQKVRQICDEFGIVYIFDEVITGFRTGPGGAQEHFGIRADLASYGKVIGGGLPIGVIAGKAKFMDALDGGGDWQYGDDSMPTAGVTYFAGTFVRHPLALAACNAVLTHLQEQGPKLQQETTAKAVRLASELNQFFEKTGAPLKIKHFASLWKTFHTEEHPFQDLLYPMIRDRGVHIADGFPCFTTTAHSQADIDFIIKQYKDAVGEMQEAGFFPASKAPAAPDPDRPPLPGAKLGRDPQGNPAWYAPHPEQPGKYIKVE